MKILSVEDSYINQTLITDRLEKGGYQVIQALDGAQALDVMLQDRDIALVLLDIGLPEKNGFEVAEFMSGTEGLKTLPVIMLTAHSTPEYQLRAAQLGVKDFFSKPIDFQQLIERIEDIIGT